MVSRGKKGWQAYRVISVIASLFALIMALSACQPKSDSPPSSASNNPSASQVASSTFANSTVTNSTASGLRSAKAPNTASANKPLDNSVTVYTSQSPENLVPIFERYKQTTGVTVNVVTGTPEDLVARLKAEDKNTTADLLLTSDVGTFAQAKQDSLFQPFSAEKINAGIPERFRSKSGEWAGVGYYARTAVYDSRVVSAKDISSYSNLAQPKWSHQLCLSRGKQVANQSLVVNLLQTLGNEKTHTILQGWVTNLAMPPLADDNAVLQAIASGQCQVGLVNSDIYGQYVEKNPDTPVKLTWINKGYGGTHINLMATAIPKYAKHPDLALALIEWLSRKDVQSDYASLNKLYPIHKDAEASVLLHSWGSFEPNPIAVSQYADKQKDAVEQMKLADYP